MPEKIHLICHIYGEPLYLITEDLNKVDKVQNLLLELMAYKPKTESELKKEVDDMLINK